MNETEKREARQRLQDYASRYLRPSKGGFYCCPICNSGAHGGGNSDGAFSIDKSNPEKWHCFSCGAGGDIFDLIGIVEGITNQGEQFKRVSDLYGIGNTHTQGGGSSRTTPPPTSEHKPAADLNGSQEQRDEPPTDFTDFFLKAHNDITKTEYAAQRGLTEYTINLFNIGYCANWKHPKHKDNEKIPITPRLIIPTSKYSYIARDTRPAELITDDEKRYTKQKAGKVHIFNFKAILTADRPIFITEGEIDAISLIEAGAAAFATGSTANINKLMELIGKMPKTDIIRQPLIIAMDNDTAGKKAAGQLEKELTKAGICFYRADSDKLYLGCKDANAALVKDKAALKDSIAAAELEALEVWAANCLNYRESASAKAAINDFINGINERANTDTITTGFSSLDKALTGYKSGGGLYEGLYIIGALSSLGKTTFTLQIGEQIAAAGTDVLIFALEMSRDELIAKSISRHTAQEVIKRGGNMKLAKTTRGITTGRFYKAYSQEEREIINTAINNYAAYADNIYIFESVGAFSVDDIKQTTIEHIKKTGKRPVIIIDYLQILAPYDWKATDKQNTDKAVLELKRLSREQKLTVIGISSFNRENYTSEVSMASFKESGAIEYGSDVLIGLQPEGMAPGNDNKEKKNNAQIVKDCKASKERKIEAVILKNRNGATYGRVSFTYHTLYNWFVQEDNTEQKANKFQKCTII